MRIAVIGAGGTGGYFGGLLARAGEDVAFVARGKHREAIRANGLTVKSAIHNDFTVRVQASDDPAEIGPVDLVLFCVKTYDNEATAALVRPLVGPETVVLSVQNGVDAAERLAEVVGEGPVIGATFVMSAVIESPGVIVHRATHGIIRVGELAGGTSPRTERLLEVFRRADLIAELHTNIRAVIWEKFVQMCALSGVTALTRLPLGTILACPETAAFFRGTMEEVETIARASGIDLPAGCVDRLVEFMRRAAPTIRGSMAFDLEAGRRLELETLNGTAVRLGRERGMATPFNFAIYAALKPYADGPPELP